MSVQYILFLQQMYLYSRKYDISSVDVCVRITEDRDEAFAQDETSAAGK